MRSENKRKRKRGVRQSVSWQAATTAPNPASQQLSSHHRPPPRVGSGEEEKKRKNHRDVVQCRGSRAERVRKSHLPSSPRGQREGVRFRDLPMEPNVRRLASCSCRGCASVPPGLGRPRLSCDLTAASSPPPRVVRQRCRLLPSTRFGGLAASSSSR